jgi:ferredoxin
MVQKKKGLISFLLGCIAAQALSGCADTTTKEQTVTRSVSTQTDDTAVEISKNDNLAIDAQKCIGCGKCVRTASSNFAISGETHKAEVISNEITSQTAIDRAVNSCPVKAITQ